MNLSKQVKISTAITPTAGAAAQTAITGTTLDMSGFEGVLCIVRMGAITGNAVTSIKMMQGASTSPATDLEGTSQTVADDDDDETFYIDVYKPTKRYVAVKVLRATQDAVVASAEYVQYGAKELPTSHATGVSGETHISPAEGTA